MDTFPESRDLNARWASLSVLSTYSPDLMNTVALVTILPRQITYVPGVPSTSLDTYHSPHCSPPVTTLSCSNNPLLWTAHLARKGSAHLARKGNLKQKIFNWKQGDISSKGTIANYFLEIVFSVMMCINIYYTYVVLNPELFSCVGRSSCLSCYFRKSETGTIFIYEREN